MTVTMQVLRAINGPLMGFGTNREIVGHIDRPEPTVRRATRVLMELGMIRASVGKVGRHTDYTITNAGRAAAKRATL